MKTIRFALIAILGVSSVAFAQVTQISHGKNSPNINGAVTAPATPPAAAKPATPPAPTTKDVNLPNDTLVEVLKLQREYQGEQLQETQRQQQAAKSEQQAEQSAQQHIEDTGKQIGAVEDKARITLKLPAGTPFDQIKLAFAVPIAK